MEQLDLNSDGEISWEEFWLWWQKQYAKSPSPSPSPPSRQAAAATPPLDRPKAMVRPQVGSTAALKVSLSPGKRPGTSMEMNRGATPSEGVERLRAGSRCRVALHPDPDPDPDPDLAQVCAAQGAFAGEPRPARHPPATRRAIARLDVLPGVDNERLAGGARGGRERVRPVTWGFPVARHDVDAGSAGAGYLVRTRPGRAAPGRAL